MSISDKSRRALEELGLTGYEIKAYVTLVDFGLMTAAEISKQSGVPYSKIYDVLSSLEEKGWLQADHSRPSKFYPKSPATALETMRMRLETLRKENEAQVLGELLPVYEKRGVKERPEIWIVRGEFNILSKVKETLEACREELLAALPSGVTEATELLAPAMSPLRQRNVKALILAAGNPSSRHLDELSRWGEVRVRERMFGGGVISDAREVVLLLGGEGERGSQLAIWAEHIGLARFAKDYFEYLWSGSKPYVKA